MYIYMNISTCTYMSMHICIYIYMCIHIDLETHHAALKRAAGKQHQIKAPSHRGRPRIQACRVLIETPGGGNPGSPGNLGDPKHLNPASGVKVTLEVLPVNQTYFPRNIPGGKPRTPQALFAQCSVASNTICWYNISYSLSKT